MSHPRYAIAPPGPVSDGNMAVFDGTNGEVLKDGGPPGGGGSNVASLVLNSTADATNPDDHPFTYLNSGIIVKDVNGTEIFRLWAGVPDSAFFNSGNTYLGFQAGRDQPTDDATAGYYNTAIGFQALLLITTGNGNTAIGFGAGGGTIGTENGIRTGEKNTIVGYQAMPESTVGTESNNVAVGSRAGDGCHGDSGSVWVGADITVTNGGVALSNAIALGQGIVVKYSNYAIIGNQNTTDIVMGGSGDSLAGTAKIHGKGDAIVFPDSDPHVAGAAYWVAGVLTKSAG